MVKLDLRGPLREQITRLNSAANPTPPAISSCSIPIAFSLARIWSPTRVVVECLVLFLPDEGLRRVYRDNAKQLLKKFT